MRKSIGPVVAENSLMVYNVKGFPRGMAIVAFQRQTDAAKARETFNGKIIDGSEFLLQHTITNFELSFFRTHPCLIYL